MIDKLSALDLNISIAAEKLFTIGGISVTNAMVTGVAGLVLMLGVLVYVAIMLRLKRYNRFVGLVQWVFEGLFKSINDIIPDKVLARKIAPLSITIFFLVLFNYWLGVIPGLDSIKFNGIPVIRTLTADLNFTLAIAIITIVTAQIYAIKYLTALGNARRYFHNPFKDPIGAFEGILELVGEVSRGTALALRLFGNAFAGEVLLIVIALLSGYLAGVILPFFMAFELFIGFIQAYVFFSLSIIFTSLAVTPHEDSTPDHSPTAKHPQPVAK